MNTFQHALVPAGTQAQHIADLWWFTLAICVVVFVAVIIAFLYALWRAPRSDAATPPDVGALTRPESRVRTSVVVALAISIVGLVVLLGASVATDRTLARLPLDNAVNITVTGHQWWWDVQYDDPQPSRMFTTANEIHIPVGVPVVITLKSDDVIHSFWVPNLHGKKDLIPGKTSSIELKADRAGVYRGQCAEFCGVQHAFMAFQVVAEPREQFAAWAEAQRRPAVEPSGEDAARGHALFTSGSCMLCHAVQGTTANARKGPDLTHVASRRTLAAGTLPNDAQHLAQWIEDPARFKPGVNMPAHHVPDADLRALVAYLETLK